MQRSSVLDARSGERMSTVRLLVTPSAADPRAKLAALGSELMLDLAVE
jgi:hypothetical protein